MRGKTLLCAVAIAACTKTKTQQPVQHPATQPSPAMAPELTPSLPPPLELTAEADPDLEDCDYLVRVDTGWGDGDTVYDCLWEDVEQACTPSTSGCDDTEETCISGCGMTCAGCDGVCADDCGGCKVRCGEDDACLAKCVLARDACHDECMGSKNTCTDEDCVAEAGVCYDEYSEYVAELCPSCDEIKECLSEAVGADDFEKANAACHEKFEAEPDECFDHCNMYSY
ncbi:MAG: hypothetical protein JKY37_29345 [Nannocystaceae bacterium]|nr:hypothetical protein [Nannocystaceae bacterium]